jgi:DNA repair protein RadC
LGFTLVSIGGLTGTIADIRLILSVALKTAATGIMLAHNHPSGALSPSHADRAITSKINEAAKLMDIKLLDHIILSPEDGEYYSFADEGVL